MFLLEGWTVNEPGRGLVAGGISRYVVQGSTMNLQETLTNLAKESASIFRIMCERWI